MRFSRIFKTITAAGCAAAMLSPLTGCGETAASGEDKLTIVTTVFATYDLAKQLAEQLDIPYEVKLLLTPGGESHAYEPTPADVAAIQSCDLFIYVGGASEKWADDLIESLGRKNEETIPAKRNLRLFDRLDLLEEEHVEGMEAEEEGHHNHADADEIEYDEHIWTSPENAYVIMHEIALELYSAAPDAIGKLQGAETKVAADLEALMHEYEDAAANATGSTLVFADRFPFRYLTDAYGWNYYAAFAGCSSDTDASAATLSFLISKVKEENIQTVFYLENSSQKISDAVCKATGAKAVMLQSLNNVSQADFDSGKHYQDFMRENLAAIKEALG